MPDASFQAPDLSGKAAVVTGASRGIGKAIAVGLGKAGCGVVVAAKSEKDRDHLPGTIHDTCEEIEVAGGRAVPIRTDVRDEAAVEAMVGAATDSFGQLDILVNNAGALWWKPIEETPPRRFDLVVGVNVRAAFLASHFALPVMKEQGFGLVINIAPPLEESFMEGKVGYGISKLGMTLHALGMAAETAPFGVGACALWPATVVESQASIHHNLGTRDQWRKPEILSDAVLGLAGMPLEKASGKAWIDEEVLATCGVDDLSGYSCVPGGDPIRIIGDSGWPTGSD